MAPLGDTHDPRTWRTDVSHLDGLNTAAVAVNRDAVVVYCNAAAEGLLLRTRGQLVGTDFADLLPTGHQGAALEVFNQALTGSAWSGLLPGTGGSGEELSLDVTASPLRREGSAVGVLFVLEDATPGTEPRGRAQRVAARLARLATVTAGLVSADDVESVKHIVVSQAADAAGATVASLAQRVDDGTLVLVGLRGTSAALASKYATVPVDKSTPIGQAVLTREAVTVTGRDQITERFPDLETAAEGERTMVALPLNVGARTIGAIGLSFPGIRSFDSTEQEFLDLLADTCAQAMDRIQARAQAEDRALKLSFLAESSAELSSSLDYQATLRRVAWLGVPKFADWCSIQLLEDGELRTLEVAHTDPAKIAMVRRLQQRYPSDPDAPRGSWHVVKTGKSELTPVVTDEMLAAAAVDEEHLRLIRALGLRSGVSAPLVARGKVLGVMTWVSSDETRVFGPSDLTFVEDLAQRAAVAIDNAQLHSETREAAVRLQRAVLPDELVTAPGWQFTSYYSPSGRTDVGGDFYDVLHLDGLVVLFVGDVMGRGVEAAAAMAQMRAAVRSYAAIDPSPQVVMSKLDTMFEKYDYTQLVTLVYVVVEPDRGEMSIVNAGHPPPLVLCDDGTVHELSEVGAPLGVGAQDRTAYVFPLDVGDTLLLYTDGLIERRGEDVDVGQLRLSEGAVRLLHGDLEESLTTLVETVRDHTREDDVAALAARRVTG